MPPLPERHGEHWTADLLQVYRPVRAFGPFPKQGDETECRDALKTLRWEKNPKDVDARIVKLLRRAMS